MLRKLIIDGWNQRGKATGLARPAEETKAKVDMLKTKLDANELRDELYAIDTRGQEQEVQRFEELIQTPEGLPEAKKILKKLQRLAKERFFEGEIAKVFTPPEKRRIKKVRIIIRPTEKKGGKFLALHISQVL